MDHFTTSKTEDDILLVTFQGQSSEANAREQAIAFLELLTKEKPTLVLVDSRSLKGRLSFGSTYFLMRDLPQSPTGVIKLAIVDNESNRDYAQFHQTTSANTGRPFQYFFDYDEALAWLRQ